MADPNAPAVIWEWLDSIWGFGAGILAGVVGVLAWVNPRIKWTTERIGQVEAHAHEENDDLAEELHSRITTMEKLVVTLEEQHKAHIELYRGLQGSLSRLSDKTDDQTKILHQLVGELTAIKDQRRHL